MLHFTCPLCRDTLGKIEIKPRGSNIVLGRIESVGERWGDPNRTKRFGIFSTPLVPVLATSSGAKISGRGRGLCKVLVDSAILQTSNLPKSFLFRLDNNSHAQAYSGFRLLSSCTIWLHFEEALLRTCY